MRIKYIFGSILVTILFGGCVDLSNKVRLNVKKYDSYNTLVDNIERQFKKCFTNQKGNLIGNATTYVSRERNSNPEHTRLNIYFDHDDTTMFWILGTITIIKKTDGNHRVIINQRELFPINNIKEWYENGMECNYEKN